MNEQIDNDQYSANQTITIKIPLSLPYAAQQDSYERAHGDFEHHGEFYKLVKKKYSDDTLYVVCLKNPEEKKAFNVLSNFVKLSTDQSSTPNHQNSKTIASVIKDYNPVVRQFLFGQREAIELAKPISFLNVTILSTDSLVISPPPEFIC